MIAEAIDTVITLGWALLAWITLCALFATAALYTLAVAAAWIVCGLWRAGRAVAALRTHTTAPLALAQPAGDSSPTETAERRTGPRWARPTQEQP